MLRTSCSRVRGRLSVSRMLDALASTSGSLGSSMQSGGAVSCTAPYAGCRNDTLRPYPLLPLRIQSMARIHVSSRPVTIGAVTSHSMLSRSSASGMPLLDRSSMQKRWVSSNKNVNNPDKKKPVSKEGAEGEKKSETEKVASVQEPGRLSSIIHSVGPTLRKVTEWNVGDLVSVYAIVLLIMLIIFSPYVIAQMKKAESEYIELDEYDPVAQMEKIVRYDLFGEEELEKEYEKEEHHDPARKSIDNTIGMAADVLQSEALQEAIASLITRVLESVQFQNACQQLLKNLWNDLVNDPETTAQVVALLNNAIQNKEIQRSTRRLVLQLIKDKEVYDELTRLLVRLGQEDEVLDATRSLLTESAHNALNDPEILDHSMEFATDVVGDDIVQRTSGEALRNTVTYAVSPGFSAFLSILGIGLVWFSISAFGKSKATEQEAAVVDKAVASVARSIHMGTREGVAAAATLPARLWSMLATIATFPLRLAEKGFSGVAKAGESVVLAVSNAVLYIIALPGAIIRATVTQLERFGLSLSEGATDTISRISIAISGSFVGQAARSVARASSSVLLALSCVTGSVRHVISASAKAVSASLSRLSSAMTGVVSSTGTYLSGMIDAASKFAGRASARLGGENVSLYLSKISTVVGGALVTSRTCVNKMVAACSQFAGMTAVRLGGVCSQCGTFVKSGVISLTARSVHAQAVALETVKRLSTQCGTLIKSGVMSLAVRSDHAQAVTMEIAKDLGASLAVAGARVSASLAAVASWCLKLFRGDGENDSSTAASL